MEANAIGISRDEGSDRHAKLFEMLLEATPSSVLLIDDQLRVVAVNRNFLEKNRKSREGALGVRLHNLLPEPLIENMDITARVRQVFDQNIKSFGGRMTYRAPGVPLGVYITTAFFLSPGWDTGSRRDAAHGGRNRADKVGRGSRQNAETCGQYS